MKNDILGSMLTDQDINKLTSVFASKKDIEEIKTSIKNGFETSKKDIEDLAIMIAHGFEGTQKDLQLFRSETRENFSKADERFDDVDEMLKYLSGTLMGQQKKIGILEKKN